MGKRLLPGLQYMAHAMRSAAGGAAALVGLSDRLWRRSRHVLGSFDFSRALVVAEVIARGGGHGDQVA